MIKRFAIAAVLAASLIGIAIAAHAYTCTTTCSGYGTYRTCTTFCF